MKNVIICEGNTDLTLIQYFLESVYGWEYIDQRKHKNYSEISPILPANCSKWFTHNNGHFLCIVSSGGAPGIPSMLRMVLDSNKIGSDFPFDRVVVISDRDEENTEENLFDKLCDEFIKFSIEPSPELSNDSWSFAEYVDELQYPRRIDILPLIIPFEGTGAIETFLLNALSEANEIDKKVIDQCNRFIDTIDCKDNDEHKRYLNHRREITKAKFDTVFVVMTPVEAFGQRRTLLRSVPWAQYQTVQESFRKLSELSQ